MDEFDYNYIMQFYEDSDIKSLESILPRYYQTNYRVAYWILKYGWGLATVLILIIAAAYIVLISMVGKIRNKAGKVLAFSCVLALLLQLVLYAAGNFGFQFGRFGNLPFVSEGDASIFTNSILVGLACSAYRYDKVFKEENRTGVYNNALKL